MNNLLRTLTESQVKSAFPDADLRLLLTTVKEGRRQSYDTKISDPFYDSLEGLLSDLKSITIDNRDAEAFLKPVSKAEVPDYYDVISNPMDFQTMLKKVKQKQYKSKREFRDDLELIWSNCLSYNATENHPLRQCVKRLKVKADRLLKYITDRKERTDPSIPSELASNVARPKPNGNGLTNGRLHRSPSTPTTISKAGTPSIKPFATKRALRRDLPFPDTPAVVRTPSGMLTFRNLDRELAKFSKIPPTHHDTHSLANRLRELTPSLDCETEPEECTDDSSNMVVGDKRKLNGVSDRPRKRARLTSQYPIPLASDKDEPSELWWGAVQSDGLLANGLPGIFPSSSRETTQPSNHRPSLKRKRRKKGLVEPPPKSLLTIMNSNIKAMKRVRHTHAKFAALNLGSGNNEDGEGGEGPAPGGMGVGVGAGAIGDDDGVGVLDDKVDEQPWRLKGKSKVRGVEVGEESASDCVRWMGEKVLEHVGFQGTSRVALDVLAGVTSEYLLNVGRTIRFLCDKYSGTMTAEEIILHTLFESGNSRIQDLERYISDDVERYGSRLTDLEKKLVSAYRESTAGEILEDEGLFDEEDEEDAGALAIGDFADALGEDYLGLRELGIAAEFGMSSLSIPKRLLKGKKGQNKPSAAAKPTEPPPPFPPPPPFIPLNSTKVDDQIGLLQPYYQSRFAALSALSASPPIPTTLPGPSFGAGSTPAPSTQPATYPDVSREVKAPVLVLPDDQPSTAQIKMGPLGQIIKAAPSGGVSKKKAKAAAAGAASGGVVISGDGTPGDDAAPKKKKGATGVGTGNGRKKKLEAMSQGQPPPVVAASA